VRPRVGRLSVYGFFACFDESQVLRGVALYDWRTCYHRGHLGGNRTVDQPEGLRSTIPGGARRRLGRTEVGGTGRNVSGGIREEGQRCQLGFWPQKLQVEIVGSTLALGHYEEPMILEDTNYSMKSRRGGGGACGPAAQQAPRAPAAWQLLFLNDKTNEFYTRANWATLPSTVSIDKLGCIVHRPSLPVSSHDLD